MMRGMRYPLRCLASFPLLTLPFFACSESGGDGSGSPPEVEVGSCGAGTGTDSPSGGTANGAGGGVGTGTGGGVDATGGDAATGTGGGTVETPGEGDPFSVFYRGANLSGAEHGIDNDGTEDWGDATPGEEGSQYAWPDPDTNEEMDEIDLFLQRGMNFYRLPIAWERIQQSLYGELDANYLGRLHDTVEAIRSRGATVMIDIHGYARYKSQGAADEDASPIIGSAEVPSDALADLWGKLATEFGETSRSSPV